jgi:dienelactone hydrolase
VKIKQSLTKNGETMPEIMQIDSASPFEIHHILTNFNASPNVLIEAELFLPQGEGPFGCIVALHGSKGWMRHHQEHINGWLDAGLAVCKVNSFTSRKIESTVDDQLSVTHAMMLVDAFRAHTRLVQDPRIDKVGIAGWSLGGTVALYAAWVPIIKILGTPFDAHVSFYPAAHIRPDIQEWSKSPILILHGDADDWTPMHLVESLLPQLPNATLQVYHGAHHSFDGHKELTWLPNAVRLRKRTARIDKNGNMSGNLFFGIRWPLNERWQRKWVIRILRNRGAHVEGNPIARADSLERAKKFVTKTIGQ